MAWPGRIIDPVEDTEIKTVDMHTMPAPGRLQNSLQVYILSIN